MIRALQPALAAARPHHWSKNLLVFAPVFLSHRWGDPAVLRSAATCFLSFCFFASFVYILNDLLDRESDQEHPSKRWRPIASGRLSRSHAGVLAVLLLVAGAAVATALPQSSRLVIIAYVLASTLYSIWAKSLLVVDVVLLGSFYTMRVIAGGSATGITISPWTLAFCLFLFFSLAVAKRYVEVDRHGPSERRSYKPEDSRTLVALGTASGLMAILVLALYINSPEVRAAYSSPKILWLMCPVFLYWISRVWLLAGRGELSDDPVVFALRDAASYAVGACAGMIVLAATFMVP